jgi:hypothetical protein
VKNAAEWQDQDREMIGHMSKELEPLKAHIIVETLGDGTTRAHGQHREQGH